MINHICHWIEEKIARNEQRENDNEETKMKNETVDSKERNARK